jgi:catechol 2,3-dioxygenase-like lactoylglutathione lyase family enzyme
MIDHLTLYVSDGERARQFYTAALAPLDYEVVMEFGPNTGFGVKGKPDFWVAQRDDALAPTHVAFRAGDRATVDAFYQAAIAAGGTDNGEPGIREMYHPNYYAAFVHDADGNNIEAVCHDPAG